MELSQYIMLRCSTLDKQQPKKPFPPQFSDDKETSYFFTEVTNPYGIRYFPGADICCIVTAIDAAPRYKHCNRTYSVGFVPISYLYTDYAIHHTGNRIQMLMFCDRQVLPVQVFEPGFELRRAYIYARDVSIVAIMREVMLEDAIVSSFVESVVSFEEFCKLRATSEPYITKSVATFAEREISTKEQVLDAFYRHQGRVYA